MSDLVVPIVITLALLAVVWLAWHLPSDPHARWREVGSRRGLTFNAPAADADGMSLSGELNGVSLTLTSREMHAGRARQFLSELRVRIPGELPHGLTILTAVSHREALARGRSTHRHDPSLPWVWQVDGGREPVTTVLREDLACSQRLTNLFVSYPEATIAEGEIRIEVPADFGSQLDATLDLTTLLAADLARVSPILTRGSGP
jgi:hypothetical protein